MKKLLPVLFVLIGLATQAQDNLVDALDYIKKKDGVYKEYYKKGQLWKQYKIKDGALDSIYTTYYSDGQPELQYHFVDGEYHGIVTLYKINGQVAFTQQVSHDTIMNETSRAYYKKSGKLRKEIIWNRKDDDYVKYMQDENKRVETQFWDCIGCLSNANGVVTKYYEDGKIHKQGKRVNQRRHGRWVWYNKDGTIHNTKIYHSKYVPGDVE